MAQVDGTGQHAEAISPPTSPPARYTSPLSEMIENTPPIPVESHPDAHSPIPVESHTFPNSTNEKKYPPASPHVQDYSALEVVEQYPPSYGAPPPGSPPPHLMSPMHQPLAFNEKGQPVIHDQANAEAGATKPTEERKVFGMRRKVFFLVLFAVLGLIILAIALGAGLGAGLKKKKSDDNGTSDPFCTANPNLCIGGALNSKYYSSKGAFNGSGIALAGESWNKNQRRIFTLYFQHHTGDIRYMQYTTDRSWVGGTKSETVASDAKNGTALSAVAFALNTTQYVHLFYVTKKNTMKQMVLSNDTGLWTSGPLTNLNLSVYDSPSVGLQACWKGNFYGDSDYSKFPTTNGDANKVPFDERVGMNLWYPSDSSTFEQYAWYNGQDTWARLNPWQAKNVHAGVGCYSWGPGTTTYAMMVNQKNDTEIWWKDTQQNATSNDTHPINSWVNSTNAAIDNVYPAASMGYTTYFYTQMADKSIKGFNIDFNAEKTSLQDQSAFTIKDSGGAAVAGLGGTHLTCTAYTEFKSGANQTDANKLWDSLYVFYQTEGNDITALSRPIAGGEWTKGKLNISDD